MKHTTCLRHWRQAGLTLIEVVAAVALMSTVLVSIVIAKSRHTRQLAMSQRQQVAVRAADELISDWWAGSSGVPAADTGTITNEPSLQWRTRIIANHAIEDWGAQVVRVEILESPTEESASRLPPTPLVSVDLVLPLPDPPAGLPRINASKGAAQ